MITRAPVFDTSLMIEELSGIRMSEERQTMVRSYLESIGKRSCREITDEDVYVYRGAFLRSKCPPSRISFFLDALEEAREWVFREEASALLSFYTSHLPYTVFARKACFYLAAHGVSSPSGIDLAIRLLLKSHLSRVGYACAAAVLSALDRMKLESIRLENEAPSIREKSLPYTNGTFFLLYHPYYPGAAAVYHTENKNSLIYDMSALCSHTIRRQFIRLLNHAMHLPEQENRLRSYYIQPLRLLYEAAVKNRWGDLEKLLDTDESAFNAYADAYYGKELKWHHQILFKARHYLFLNSDEIHWDATVWFLERMQLEQYRISPSCAPIRFSFCSIHDPDSRMLFQEYLRYLLGLTDRALSTIKGIYRDLTVFLKFLEKKTYDMRHLTLYQFEHFITFIDAERSYGDLPFNRLCEHICDFYAYLSERDLAEQLAFDPRSYKRIFRELHHNRAVPEAIQQYTLKQLQYFPEELRLMYLHLWCTGLRISEVCTIKAGNYMFLDGEPVLYIFQPKMRREKRIPIPNILYVLVRDYIHREQLSPDDYVFRNTKGGPYNSGTFRVKMKKYCDMYGINQADYMFRSHDFRHTVATQSYEQGMTISSIRDYLGHTQSDMTKQYIDYIPEKINQLNREYFAENPIMEDSHE